VTGRVGAYPGSFDPPTVAHLAIAELAKAHAGLDRVDFVLSRTALGKETGHHATLEDRVAALESMAASRPWLGVRVTDAQLLVDVATGYDVLILGADKWAQVVDPAWYGGSEAARDDAVRRLPRTIVFARPPHPPPHLPPHLPTDDRLEVIDIGDDYHAVSSTAVRAGRRDWMAPEAIAFDDLTRVWSHSGDD
jgi:nicotinic acid mononucleotide adenylyltransferase